MESISLATAILVIAASFQQAPMGGLVVHPYGIAATQPLGETMALVKADNAAGVKVANNGGIYTDSKGFAVVPYVTPYRQNSLSLDTATLNNNTDVLNDTRTVVPTKGALALADYPTVTGYKNHATAVRKRGPVWGNGQHKKSR